MKIYPDFHVKQTIIVPYFHFFKKSSYVYQIFLHYSGVIDQFRRSDYFHCILKYIDNFFSFQFSTSLTYDFFVCEHIPKLD